MPEKFLRIFHTLVTKRNICIQSTVTLYKPYKISLIQIISLLNHIWYHFYSIEMFKICFKFLRGYNGWTFFKKTHTFSYVSVHTIINSVCHPFTINSHEHKKRKTYANEGKHSIAPEGVHCKTTLNISKTIK